MSNVAKVVLGAISYPAIQALDNNEVVQARNGYPTLDARLDDMMFSGSNVATVTTSDTSTTSIPVISSAGFSPNQRIGYTLSSGALEYRIIQSVPDATHLTLTAAPSGTIPSATNIFGISDSEYQAAVTAVPQDRTRTTLPDIISILSRQVYSLDQYLDNGLADVDGTTDNTAAAQALIDDIPNTGGVMLLPAHDSAYRLGMLTVDKPLTVIGQGRGKTVIKRYGTPDEDARAIFYMADEGDIFFSLENMTVDLNGEALNEVGVTGRVVNDYSDSSGIHGINATPNSAVFALRCAHIRVSNVEIVNTAESGLLFRNCANVLVENTRFENICGSGIEFSFPATDGGVGAMPVRRDYRVLNCHFEDIDDLKLGAGNAIAVSFAGSASNELLRDVFVEGNMMLGCGRGIHVEFNAGTRLVNVRFHGNIIREARQGGIAANHCINLEISNNLVVDCSSAPVTLNAAWPDMYGIRVAGATHIRVLQNDIIDTRDKMNHHGSGGSISAGSFDMTVVSHGLTTAYNGQWIGVEGAGPDGSILISKIDTIPDVNTIRLKQQAYTTVSGADFAYGGAARRPLDIRGVNVDIIGNRVRGGVFSSLSSEPDSAAMWLESITGTGAIYGNTLLAPTSGEGTFPRAVYFTGVTATTSLHNNTITGFDVRHDNTNGLTQPRDFETVQGPTTVTVSTTIDTYGTAVDFEPQDGWMFIGRPWFFGETQNMGSETVTVELSATYRAEDTREETVTFTSNGEKKALFDDEAWVTYFAKTTEPVIKYSFRVKSSIGSSTAQLRIWGWLVER